MPAGERFAYVVDDADAVRSAIQALLADAGYGVEAFETGEAFLAAADNGLPPGCVLLDLRLPGLDGLGVLREVMARRLPHPVVMVTAHVDVAGAVQAMKDGACDVIEKPFATETLLRAADGANRRDVATRAHACEAAERLAALSRREVEVLRGVVAGHQNKMIARELGISPRTVEIHRGNVMAKLGVRSVPEAVRLAVAAGLEAAPP